MENVKVSKNQERIGQTVLQNCGELASIVEYINSEDITIQFKRTGELVKCTYGTFVRGGIKSHFSPTVYGVGITGVESIRDENGELLNSYICWQSMLQRCYSDEYQKKYPTYKGCYVSEGWLYYPNFKKWYDDNYYEIENKTSQLDKDILVKNNKVYSPNTCIFTPNFINTLFIKCQKIRGDFPVGVYYNKRYKKYVARLRIFKNGKKTRKYLGSFDTVNEAFEVYKKAKEDYVKEIADNYKDKIPTKLYEAMYSYKVDIDD